MVIDGLCVKIRAEMQEEKGENVLLSNEKHLNLSSHKC